MKKLRVALIGTGNICETHITRYENNPNVEIAAVCDINEAKLYKFADATMLKRV